MYRNIIHTKVSQVVRVHAAVVSSLFVVVVVGMAITGFLSVMVMAN